MSVMPISSNLSLLIAAPILPMYIFFSIQRQDASVFFNLIAANIRNPFDTRALRFFKYAI